MNELTIIVITQKHVGTALVKAAKNIFGQLPIEIITVSVNYRVNPCSLVEKLQKVTNRLPEGRELLVLTDLYGSTPSNIANRLTEVCTQKTRVIAGLNLPMLVKVLSAGQQSLDEVSKTAVFGGRQGVLDCGCLAC
jgi:mannose PTS system EIIA component